MWLHLKIACFDTQLKNVQSEGGGNGNFFQEKEMTGNIASVFFWRKDRVTVQPKTPEHTPAPLIRAPVPPPTHAWRHSCMFHQHQHVLHPLSHFDTCCRVGPFRGCHFYNCHLRRLQQGKWEGDNFLFTSCWRGRGALILNADLWRFVAHVCCRWCSQWKVTRESRKNPRQFLCLSSCHRFPLHHSDAQRLAPKNIFMD